MSYWLYGKNSEGKKTITSSNLFGWTHNNSWLSIISLAVSTTFLIDLLLLFILGKFLQNIPATLGIVLFIFFTFGVFVLCVQLLRPKKKLSDPTIKT